VAIVDPRWIELQPGERVDVSLDLSALYAYAPNSMVAAPREQVAPPPGTYRLELMGAGIRHSVELVVTKR
jgi:hypothetical protein